MNVNRTEIHSETIRSPLYRLKENWCLHWHLSTGKQHTMSASYTIWSLLVLMISSCFSPVAGVYAFSFRAMQGDSFLLTGNKSVNQMWFIFGFNQDLITRFDDPASPSNYNFCINCQGIDSPPPLQENWSPTLFKYCYQITKLFIASIWFLLFHFHFSSCLQSLKIHSAGNNLH